MDTEPVTLRESAVNSGIFRGQIPLRGAAGANNDGQLNVIATAAGATITAYYMDKDDTANPDPDESTDTATVVDTTAPAPVNLPVNTLTATTGPSGRSANLDWSGYDEAAQIDVAGYRVYYAAANFGNTQAAGVQLYTTVPAGRKTATVNGLTPNTQYWFAVVAYDEVPNPSTAVATPVTPATLTTRDTTGPVISNLSPANGATEVPANTIMGFRVSDAGVGVDIGTLFVEVTVGGTPVAINVNTSDQGAYTQVTVTPTNPFAWNDVVNVDVAVWDRDGNAAPDVPWTFSIVTDTTNPQVTQQSPADGVTGVPVTTQVSFHLTDNKSGIDLSTLAVTFNGTNITGDLAPSQVNGNLDILCTYTPPENLLYSSDYKVSVTVSDFADRTSGMVEWTFRTVDDQTGVIIDQFDPAPRDDNVPIDTNIRMRMSDNQAGVNVASIRLWVDGPEVTGAIATTVQGSSVFVEYDPQQDLPYGTDIWVIVDVKDNNGNGNPFTYYFTTVAAPTYVISGRTLTAAGDPVAGVTITCDGTTTTTDGNGAYLLTNLPAGNYTVTPTKAEWSFDPLSRQITLGPNDATDVNFVGALATYSISGTVRNRAGTGQAGVAVACGTSSAITNANGQYTIAGKRRGQHTLTPLLANYQFEPVNRVVNIENSNVVGQDFTAVAGTFTISGTVYDAAGGRIQGVEVTNGVNVAVTTSAGTYTLTNLAMGAHNVTATKLGYRLLTTASLDQWQVDLPPDYTGADFVAYFELGNSFPGGIHLIGVPGTPVIGNPINVFGTTRVARWDPTANPPDYLLAQQYGDTDFMRVYPGSGYFVNFYDATNLSIAGQPTDTSRPVSMGVGVGWNMIANPFANPTPFGNFQPTIPDGVLPYAFIYNHATGSYELVSSKASINAVRSTLQPWEGAWVRCVAGGCSLNVTAQVGATAVVEPEQAEVGTGYILPVVATASGRSDTSSVAGVIPGAGSQHTLPNPPPAPASVDVYFVNSSGQQLSRDFRSQSGSCDTYEFVVSCGVGSADVTVTLPDMSSVPNNREVMLTDVDAQKTVYARTMQAYTYRSDEGTTQRRFRIDIQPRTVGSLNISAAAGQRGGGATITYSVSQSCKVNIIVRNIAGRCIKVLAADQVASAGLNTQVWNLANETGAKVPAGPYLIEIRAVADNGQQARALANITLKR